MPSLFLLVVGLLPTVLANNKCCPSAKIYFANQPKYLEDQPQRNATSTHIFDAECLVGRRHLDAWPNAPRGTWALQSIDVEKHFMRYALDFLSGDRYWTSSGGVVPKQERVVAIRTDEPPPDWQFAAAPVAAEAYPHYTVCQDQPFNDIKVLVNALKESGAWLAVIPSAATHLMWQDWYNTHLKPTIDELCADDEYCLAGVHEGSGDVVADIKEALASVDVEGNGFLDCVPCSVVDRIADLLEEMQKDTTTFCIGCQTTANDTDHELVHDFDEVDDVASAAVNLSYLSSTWCLLVLSLYL